MKKILFLTLTVVVFSLTGCGAMHSVLPEGNLDFDSRMSSTVFLDSDKLSDPATKIFVRGANTSSFTDIDFQKAITDHMLARGFKLTKNSKEATFVMQANLLYFGEEDSQHTMDGMLAGAAVGAVGGGIAKGGSGALIGAGGGALLGAAVGSMTNTTSIIAVTDILIEERKGKTLTPVAQTRLVTRVKQFNGDKPKMYELLRSKTPVQVAGQFGG